MASALGRRAQTVYLGICGALLLLSLPPEVGRVAFSSADALIALLLVQLLAVTYLTSAMASGELGVEGEKGLPDLALSSFAPATIARGKLQSSAAFAAMLVASGAPLVVLAAVLRGDRLFPVVAAGVLTVIVAAAAGVWGAWLGGRFSSEFVRSVLHWLLLALALGGAAALPSPWWVLSPVRMVDGVVRSGLAQWIVAGTAVYAGLAAAGTIATAACVRDLRSGALDA